MIPYDLDPTVYVPVVLAISILAIGRIHASPRWFCPNLAWFWNPIRIIVWPIFDKAFASVPFLYAKTTVNRSEYAATLAITMDELRSDLSDVGYEAQPLSSLAKDWEGRVERGSFARYYGKPLFPGAPNWLRKKQVHVRPFGRNGAIDVSAHSEYNPYHPLFALPHLFGIGLTPAPEMVANDLGIQTEDYEA